MSKKAFFESQKKKPKHYFTCSWKGSAMPSFIQWLVIVQFIISTMFHSTLNMKSRCEVREGHFRDHSDDCDLMSDQKPGVD